MVAITGLTADSSSEIVSSTKSSSSSSLRPARTRALTNNPVRATAMILGAKDATDRAPMVVTQQVEVCLQSANLE